jgi:hypothetical protein
MLESALESYYMQTEMPFCYSRIGGIRREFSFVTSNRKRIWTCPVHMEFYGTYPLAIY